MRRIELMNKKKKGKQKNLKHIFSYKPPLRETLFFKRNIIIHECRTEERGLGGYCALFLLMDPLIV